MGATISIETNDGPTVSCIQYEQQKQLIQDESSLSSSSYRCFGGWIPLDTTTLSKPVLFSEPTSNSVDMNIEDNITENEDNDGEDGQNDTSNHDHQVPVLTLSAVSSCSTLEDDDEVVPVRFAPSNNHAERRHLRRRSSNKKQIKQDHHGASDHDDDLSATSLLTFDDDDDDEEEEECFNDDDENDIPQDDICGDMQQHQTEKPQRRQFSRISSSSILTHRSREEWDEDFVDIVQSQPPSSLCCISASSIQQRRRRTGSRDDDDDSNNNRSDDDDDDGPSGTFRRLLQQKSHSERRHDDITSSSRSSSFKNRRTYKTLRSQTEDNFLTTLESPPSPSFTLPVLPPSSPPRSSCTTTNESAATAGIEVSCCTTTAQMPVSPTSVLELKSSSSTRCSDSHHHEVDDDKNFRLHYRRSSNQSLVDNKEDHHEENRYYQQHKRTLQQLLQKGEWFESSQVNKFNDAIHVYRECVQQIQKHRHDGHLYNNYYSHYQLACAHLYIYKIGLLYYKIGNYQRSVCAIKYGIELIQSYGYGCLTYDEAIHDALSMSIAYDTRRRYSNSVHNYYNNSNNDNDIIEDDKEHRLCLLFTQALVSLGQVYVSMGQAKESKDMLKDAMRILKHYQCHHQQPLTGDKNNKNNDTDDNSYHHHHHDEYHILFCKGLVALGTVYESEGRLQLAMKHYQRGYEQQNKSFQKQQMIIGSSREEDIAETLSYIGGIYVKYGWYHPAMNCYLEALRIYRSQLSQQQQQQQTYKTATTVSPIDIGVTLASIGWIHYLCGQYSAAMKASTDALTIIEQLLGTSHRNTSSIQFQIGLIMKKQREQDHEQQQQHYYNSSNNGEEMNVAMDDSATAAGYMDVLRVFKHVLEVQRYTLGDDHDDVAITLDASADVYKQLQRFERAISFEDRALGIRKRVWGKEHLLVGMTYSKLGDLYVSLMASYSCHHNNSQNNKESMIMSSSTHDDNYKNKRMAKKCFSSALQVYQANKVKDDDFRVIHCKQALREVF